MIWITSNWRALLNPSLAVIALAVVALICGAIIGTEREKREKAAGLRTLILVCLGSAAFTMVSFIFSTNSGDSGRVAAQIVTGIGFLGAGVILHGRNTITGTTTAATIWVTASVGMIAGAGYAGAALGMSLFVRLVLKSISVYENHVMGGQAPVLASLKFNRNEGLTRVRLERILVDYRIGAVAAEWENVDAITGRLKLTIHLPRLHLRELMDDLVNIPGVTGADEEILPSGR